MNAIIVLMIGITMATGEVHSIQNRYNSFDGMDILVPYSGHHGPRLRRNRHIRECQSFKYGNVTHSKHPAHKSDKIDFPLIVSKHALHDIGDAWNKRVVNLHYELVGNPLRTLSVLEPLAPGSCRKGEGLRATVKQSSRQANCLLAINAGFFNTHTGECHGNIFSNGHLIQDSGGIQNAHFGITRDGYIFVGYLSEIDLLTQHFTQLVGGVIWLLRDGEKYVKESLKFECSDTEETGTLKQFVDVRSSRTAIGHDKHGHVLIIQVEGKTGTNAGVSLWEFADILLDYGLVNAINLDGGGSSTMVVNQTVINYPTDKCEDKMFNCARNVSTIVCVHEPACEPPHCSHHGVCQRGQCVCSGYWSGPECNVLSCPDNCSRRGHCKKDGCLCDPGWHGNNCSLACPVLRFGQDCSQQCACQNGGVCDTVSGSCTCRAGYTGQFCQSICPYGFFGARCKSVCLCEESCFCDHVNGSCDNGTHYAVLKQASECVTRQVIKKRNLVVDQADQYNKCLVGVVVLSIVSCLSLILNMYLTCAYVNVRKKQAAVTRDAVKKTIKKFVFHNSTDADSETLSDDVDEVTSLVSSSQNGHR
ncbi:N-acetylglucosamine-1-phosphodiester alpha-N-acetylglucosaminidase-like [Gigantopelta aegis]|uniref:N-acetylglucosamine-1-phosphodiester alpha-N-acetylglucosaminidase-like n=1 Tax=Gigantopelta aegis TaxID=1735272 RepID=UPI001B88B10E|nr:N-acetylglucosamine-1-phosphodiester alpha-N-acetylglucosaminidase-like [Gigantopelta aegis]